MNDTPKALPLSEREQRYDEPAFPVTVGMGYLEGFTQNGASTVQMHGLTMRDFFAAQALPLAHAQCGPHEDGWRHVVQVAYVIADWMIEERTRK